jgi:GNAT superfamily N-acetyltransferase
VTYAAIWNVERHKYRFDLIVDDAWRRRGIGSQSLAMVLTEAQRAGARTLQARAYAECTDAIAFLTRREFVETMRMQGFLLDLLRIDDGALSTQRQRLTSTHIVIVPATISDISDREFWRKIAGLQFATQAGWPDPDPDGIVDVMSETELRRMLIPSGELPLAFFVAERRGEFLGYSVLAVRAHRDREAQFVATAVRPEARYHGIATALRARCLSVAKAAGVQTIRSTSGHLAILRMNERLGFRPTYCEVRLVRRLDRPL